MNHKMQAYFLIGKYNNLKLYQQKYHINLKQSLIKSKIKLNCLLLLLKW
jgi:hypothetical protein